MIPQPQMLEITCNAVTNEFVKTFGNQIKALKGSHSKSNKTRTVCLPYPEGCDLANRIINTFPSKGKVLIVFKGIEMPPRIDLISQIVDSTVENPVAEAFKQFGEKWSFQQ